MSARPTRTDRTFARAQSNLRSKHRARQCRQERNTNWMHEFGGVRVNRI